MSNSSREASFSLPSILAIVAAIGSFFTGAALQLLLALAAIVLGVLGVTLSLSPAKRGGMTSILSIVLGVIAIVVALIRGLVAIIS